jgi:hypothetical protein
MNRGSQCCDTASDPDGPWLLHQIGAVARGFSFEQVARNLRYRTIR